MGTRTRSHPGSNPTTHTDRSRIAARVVGALIAILAYTGMGIAPVSAAPAWSGTWTMTQYRPIRANFWTDWSTRIYHGATQIKGGPWTGRGLICGGNDKSAFLWGEYATGACYTYDAASNAWQAVSGAGAQARMMMSLDATNDGRAVLFGGTTVATAAPNNQTWMITPTSATAATWTMRTPAVSPPARGGHAHVALADGRTMIFGGRAKAYMTTGCAVARNQAGWMPCRLADTWIYDPNDGPQGSWKQVTTPVAPSARDFAMLAPYGRGAILFGGGVDDWYLGQPSTNDETWFFDPGTVDAAGNVVGASWRLIDVAKPADFTSMSHGSLTALGGGLFVQAAGYETPSTCQHCQQYRVLDMAASPGPRWDEKITPPWGGRDYSQAWSVSPGTAVMFGGQGNQNNEFSVWEFQLAGAVSTPVACNNGLDDDGDGLVDTADGGCAAWTATSEG